MEKEFETVLSKEGVEVSEALDRLSNDEGLYLRLLSSFLLTDPLKELKDAIKKHDTETSIRAVHSLKGVTLNLGLLNLADPCIEMLQLYRQGAVTKADALFPKVEEAFSSFITKVKSYLKEGES